MTPPRRAGWPHATRRWRHSIRARLVALFVLLALLLAGVFVVGTQRVVKTGWQGWVQPLVADYLDRLAADLGSPPDLARAQALVQRLPVTLRIDGPLVHYDSHPQLDRYRPWHGHDTERAAEGWGLVRQTADGHRIRFALAAWPEADRPRRLGWVTLAVLLLLTAAAWGVVQHLLRPLRDIGAGAERYGRGDFSQPITLRQRDELGDLAARVDAMAAALRQRLEDKHTLLLAISHELRSPLTRARLNAELVAGSPERDALLRDLAEMRDLIATLLESERIAAGAPALQRAPVDLAALLHQAVAAVPEGPRPTLALEAEPAAVLADAARLELLLRNLIDNARRHGGDGAAVPQVFLRRQDDGRLALGVRDHGPGVAPDQLERLAQAFYRPDSARTRASGGVGLGLYLCRLVAQAHGGKFEVSNASPGLLVVVQLPA